LLPKMNAESQADVMSHGSKVSSWALLSQSVIGIIEGRVTTSHEGRVTTHQNDTVNQSYVMQVYIVGIILSLYR